MPYRDFTLPDGRIERVRVSDEAVMQWWRERSHGTGAGYLDRPPDFDSETQRVWIPRPGEEGWVENALRRQGDRINRQHDFCAYTLAINTPGMVQKVIVNWRAGRWDVHGIVKMIADGSTVLTVDAEPDADGDIADVVNLLIERFAEVESAMAVLTDWTPEPWMETTYEGFVAMDEALTLAREEAAAEFGSVPITPLDTVPSTARA